MTYRRQATEGKNPGEFANPFFTQAHVTDDKLVENLDDLKIQYKSERLKMRDIILKQLDYYYFLQFFKNNCIK